MRKTLKSKIAVTLGIFFLSLNLSPLAHAAEITQTTVDARNDFVLEPAKIEVILDPGTKETRSIYVTSRITKPTKFRVEIEDFIGSDQPDKPVILLGNDKSPYSLKDYLKPEINEFTLNFGDRIRIPIDIDLPPNAAPGGFYASVLISNAPDKLATSSNEQTQTKTISRVGALLFVRVNGQVNENGQVEDFRIKNTRPFYQRADLTFQILFRNNGSVHLVPYGTIEIKNIWGKVIDTLPVDAYFSLPQSLRYREIYWQHGGLLGYYQATLNLHRGYGQLVDTRSISIWIIPWKIIIAIFVIILILVSVYYYISRNFEFRRRKK